MKLCRDVAKLLINHGTWPAYELPFRNFLVSILTSNMILMWYVFPIQQTASSWADKLEKAQKTALVQDGRRKIHYNFSDGFEMAEEYDVKTNLLLVRKWRCKGTLGNQKPWELEVGELIAPLTNMMKELQFAESSHNPVVVRRDTLDAFQWRIRNLPYPIDTYELSIENESIVVRTTNKKYYKKITIPDLDRLGQPMDSANLTYSHSSNTLIISYAKPDEVKGFERRLLSKLRKLKSEGDVDQCKQQ